MRIQCFGPVTVGDLDMVRLIREVRVASSYAEAVLGRYDNPATSCLHVPIRVLEVPRVLIDALMPARSYA